MMFMSRVMCSFPHEKQPFKEKQQILRQVAPKSLKFYLKTVEGNQPTLCHQLQMITHTLCMSKVELVWKNLVVKLDYACVKKEIMNILKENTRLTN